MTPLPTMHTTITPPNEEDILTNVITEASLASGGTTNALYHYPSVFFLGSD